MPANVYFSVDIDGDRELSRTLHGYLASLKDLAPFFEDFADEWKATQRQVFASEGGYETEDDEGNQTKWPELSAKYAAWKAQRFPGKPILQRTGDLLEAATNPTTDITPTSLTMTIESDYAIYHQSSRPRDRLPRRPFASLTRGQKTRLMRRLRERLIEAVR
ncbi:MAG: hypothetical protein HUU35_16265 [Armatimonadetes bacterium]|nr:hypothetical protein [Armatimonadota bacterium]